eukprot:442561-Pleurochrysis_carterae.AAC.1
MDEELFFVGQHDGVIKLAILEYTVYKLKTSSSYNFTMQYEKTYNTVMKAMMKAMHKAKYRTSKGDAKGSELGRAGDLTSRRRPVGGSRRTQLRGE